VQVCFSIGAAEGADRVGMSTVVNYAIRRGSLACKSNQMKKRHLFSTFAFQMPLQSPSLIAPLELHVVGRACRVGTICRESPSDRVLTGGKSHLR
jgi:hypothetical protein